MGYWIIDTAGIGSIIVFAVGLAVLAAYVYMVRWIQTAPLDQGVLETGQPGEEAIANEAGGKEE